MDLQPPSTSSILARRSAQRPTLKRNQSSFITAISRLEESDNVDIVKALEIVSLDPNQKDLVKEDLKLAYKLEDEQIPGTPSVESISSPSTPSRYEAWECGFSTPVPAYTPSSIPSKPEDFLHAVRDEIKTLVSVRAGLLKYVEVLGSGEHQVFSEGFLDSQNKATNITVSQLDQIKQHLNEIVSAVEQKVDSGTQDEGTQETVSVDLQEAFGHAKPWIARTRAIMINSHVFYKINYALAADKKAEKK